METSWPKNFTAESLEGSGVVINYRETSVGITEIRLVPATSWTSHISLVQLVEPVPPLIVIGDPLGENALAGKVIDRFTVSGWMLSTPASPSETLLQEIAVSPPTVRSKNAFALVEPPPVIVTVPDTSETCCVERLRAVIS